MNIGDRFGKLVVVELHPGAKNAHCSATCRCDCGDISTHRLTRLRTGKAIRCAKCGAAESWANRGRPSPETMAIRRCIEIYIQNAKRRNLDFTLSADRCVELFSGPCRYCGSLPSRVVKARGCKTGATLHGIDRADNSVGYIEGNVVTCCTQCNFAKRDMTTDEFLTWARLVVRHNGGDK